MCECRESVVRGDAFDPGGGGDYPTRPVRRWREWNTFLSELKRNGKHWFDQLQYLERLLDANIDRTEFGNRTGNE